VVRWRIPCAFLNSASGRSQICCVIRPSNSNHRLKVGGSNRGRKWKGAASSMWPTEGAVWRELGLLSVCERCLACSLNIPSDSNDLLFWIAPTDRPGRLMTNMTQKGPKSRSASRGIDMSCVNTVKTAHCFQFTQSSWNFTNFLVSSLVAALQFRFHVHVYRFMWMWAVLLMFRK
jgi:hypothetical protein